MTRIGENHMPYERLHFKIGYRHVNVTKIIIPFHSKQKMNVKDQKANFLKN